MNSLDRIFNSINEAKKAKSKAMIPSHSEKKGGQKSKLGKSNVYDHDHKMEKGENGMQTESSHMKKKKKLIGKQRESKEIMSILDLIKEAYQEELISEEAFLAIADPILRSLMEGRSVNFPDTYEMEDLDDAEAEEEKKLSPKQKKIAGVAGNPKKIDSADLAALRRKGRGRRK